MRDPRPGLPWSRRRAQRRVDYATWMASAAWRQRRADWHERWVATFGSEPVCLVCGKSWTLRNGDLHHRSYRRLGHEGDADLIPLCRTPCHQQLHRILESNPAWLKLGRVHATDVIIAHLRAEARHRENANG